MNTSIHTRELHPVRVLLVLSALCLLLSAVLLANTSASGQAEPFLPGSTGTPGALYKAGEILIQYKADAVASGAAASATAVLESAGATFERNLYASEVQLWQVPVGREEALSAALSRDPAVEFAELNYAYQVINTPNDPRFGQQWAHQKVNSTAGWDLTTGSSGIIISIIDTGVDLNHPDLAGKYVPGYDFVDNDAVPRDGFGHGTHVAGISGALTNNNVGVAGVDWGARIMPIRSLDNDGAGYSDDITDGINWSVANGADIINMILGGPSYSSAMQNAVNAAHANGVLVVAAMGNARQAGNPTQYPAAYNNVLAVSSTAPDDTYSYFSQYGAHNDVAAPGGEMSYLHDPNGIMSALPTYAVTLNGYGYNQGYDYLHGTSMAAPMVAGLAGLIWSLAPNLTPDQVQAAIEDTAVDLGAGGWDPDYGHGRINIYAALLPFLAPDAPVLNPVANPDGDGDYTVSWNNVSLATGYVLQEDQDPGFTSPATVYSGALTSVALSGRDPGFNHYRVKATSASGDSPWSNVQSVGVAPAPPSLSAISNPDSDGDYQLEWSAPDTATSYLLEEDDNPGFNSPETRFMGAATSYEVTGQGGGDWYYRVLATSVAGSSAWSNTRSTSVDPPPLDAPSLQSIVNGNKDGDYSVEWTAVVSATSYVLEQSASRFFLGATVVYSGPMTEKTFTDQPGGTWYYRVRAQGDPGLSAWSNARSTEVTAFLYLPVLIKP